MPKGNKIKENNLYPLRKKEPSIQNPSDPQKGSDRMDHSAVQAMYSLSTLYIIFPRFKCVVQD